MGGERGVRGDDIDSDVEAGPDAPAAPMTSIAMSPRSGISDGGEPPPHPDPVLAARGLPDYAAILAAELAVAADVEASSTAPSPLGVGEVVLSARELAGISQRLLAARAATTQAEVTAIESGNRLPTVRLLMRLVEAAELDLLVGLRRAGADAPIVLGALVPNADDGLADYIPIQVLSPFEGPPER